MQKKPAGKVDLRFLTKYNLRNDHIKDAVLFKFEPGEFFLREGQAIDYLYFVLSGKAKVYLNALNGKQLLLCYFISSGIIGDLELMTEQKNAFTTVQAISDFICIGLPLASNTQYLKNNILFVNHVGMELAYKLKQRDVYCAITVLHSLEERLCAYIAQTAIDGVFCESLTDVAGFLGTSYRHLLRCLNKLCRDGILEKQNNGFLILNKKILNKLATELYML